MRKKPGGNNGGTGLNGETRTARTLPQGGWQPAIRVTAAVKAAATHVPQRHVPRLVIAVQPPTAFAARSKIVAIPAHPVQLRSSKER
jgi:hypothetical protein